MAFVQDASPSIAVKILSTAIIAGLGGFIIGQASPMSIFGRSQRLKPGPIITSDEDEDSHSDASDSPELQAFSGNDEECKLVLVVRTDLGMTKGKIAAQCGHGTLACYKALVNSPTGQSVIRRWERWGQAKVALQVKGEDDLQLLQAQAVSLGLCAKVIHDAGRTQIASGSATVLSIGPGPKSVIDQVTGHLKLL